MRVQASAWISGEDQDNYWAEGVRCEIEVEPTDVDEIRIGVKLSGDDSDTATVYVSRKTADSLARMLAAASVIDARVNA
jgi:hypothetical protein